MIIATIFYMLFGGVVLFVYKIVSVRSMEAERITIERIAAFVTSAEGDVAAIGRGIARQNLVQCLAFVAEMTTGPNERFGIIMKYYHIESYMISRIFKSKNLYERAYQLSGQRQARYIPIRRTASQNNIRICDFPFVPT